MSIPCDPSSSSQYAILVFVSIFGMVQVFVVPLLIDLYLWVALFRKGGWSLEAREQYVEFLHDMYEDHAWFFESFRIYRKICFALVAQLVYPLGNQFIAAATILSISLCIVVRLHPYLSY